MDSEPVAVVDCEKDLGITFSQDLKVAAHCKLEGAQRVHISAK